MKCLEFTARKNTWSHQRRKRREEQHHESERKKPKLDDSSSTDTSFCLKGSFQLHETDELITLHMNWVEGGTGRDSINQILQYLINNLLK